VSTCWSLDARAMRSFPIPDAPHGIIQGAASLYRIFLL
jgi:hypothetical protein